MEIEESRWINKAIDNIERYLNRGGDLKGDDPQILGGTDLLNTIGVAMGLPVRDPRNWTKQEMERALKNQLVYFEGDARKAIDVIAEQIKYCCNGSEQNYVTVLPIELYWGGKLYELPVFRVHRDKNSHRYYVDNTGRRYSDVNDWYTNSVLPPCKMIYPYDLKLTLRPGQKTPRVSMDDTPSVRPGSQFAKGMDIAAAVAGIGSGVGLMFASGGLAAPLVATGVATAAWGTGRTSYQLIDKAAHGEDINPFTNPESRMLWLGIAANIVSFGAMGASMRLTSLAARGREISNAFRVLVNVMNGTNVVVSGIAIMDTTIFLIENCEKLTPVDVLIHVASMAFWTKGVFTYKTAGTLIRNAQDHTFKIIGRELTSADAAKLSSVRQILNNDSQLIREFHRAAKSNIPIKTFSHIVIDVASVQGKIQFDGAGNLILKGGQKYSFDFLSKLPQSARRNYFDAIANLRADQIELLENFRHKVNNDMKIISALNSAVVHCQITPREATEELIKFWGKYRHMNLPLNADISIREDSLVLGRAPPLQINQLRGLSNSMVRFVGDHLARMDETTSRQWTTSIPMLLKLESQGMFSLCQVTRIIPTGRAVLLLNGTLQISIYKLNEIDPNDCKSMLTLVGQLPPNMASNRIPKDTLKLTNKYRLRLECHRTESVNWMIANANSKILPLLKSNLQSFEKDRLFTFRNTVETAKAMPYIKQLMTFVSILNPRNISEMVSYGEFIITCVEGEKRNLEGEIRSGRLQLPPNRKKADFLRELASEGIYRDPRAIHNKWGQLVDIVRRNSMVGPVAFTPGLKSEALIKALGTAKIGFGSEASAAYHILKHPTDPLSAYVIRANQALRNASSWEVNLTQDGDSRLLKCESSLGSVILLERAGSVLLCTYTPKISKPQ